MFKSRIRAWHLGKNASKEDWLAIAILRHRRQLAGKPEGVFQVHDKWRSVADLRRYLKDHKSSAADFLDEAIGSNVPIPQHIRCVTPESACELPSTSGNISQPSAPVSSGDSVYDKMVLPTPLTSTAPRLPPLNSRDPKPGAILPTAIMSVEQEHGWTTVERPVARLPVPVSVIPDSMHEYLSLEHDGWPPEVIDPLHLSKQNIRLQQNMDYPATQALEDNKWEVLSQQPGNIDSWNLDSPFHNDFTFHSIRPEGHSRSRTQTPQPLERPNLTTELPQIPPRDNPDAGAMNSQKIDDYSAFTTACMLACMYGARREYDVLGLCLGRASDVFRKMLIANDPLVLTAACTILTWLHVHEQGEIAESIIRAARRVAMEVLGESSPICLTLEWMTAAAAKKLEDCRIQTEMLQTIYSGFQASHGMNHHHTIAALYCLSFHLLRVDNAYEEAENHLQHLYTICAETLGPSDLHTVSALSTLSRAQSRLGKHELALETMKRCLQKAPLGQSHPHRLESIRRLALIYKKLGRMEDTERLYWEVLKGRIATLGKHHVSTQKAHESLVSLLQEMGRWDAMKGDVQRLLTEEPQGHVSDDESSWRRVVAQCSSNDEYKLLHGEETE
jgi:tetratricopeptide (TPR) repeat protein